MADERYADERDLLVRSGAGGDGIVAWRREARVPRGGPAGGDGGRGGDVYLVADPELSTFGDMEEIHLAAAEDGERGGPDKCQGRSGRDKVVRVPVGTSVYDLATRRRLVDLATPGRRWRAARGGNGGRGNARFASATEQRPMRRELGEKGRERRLRLELRLLADVGLVGLPNAGKSTLLSRLTRARPRIGAWPFTTLSPHLGILDLGDGRRVVLADLPGLIEGAHEGHGLGHRFLRHVERTRVLVHLVDLATPSEDDPGRAWRQVRAELGAHGHGLAERPEIVVGTKVDALAPGDRAAALSRLSRSADREVHPISAVTGEGLPALLAAIGRTLGSAPAPPEPPRRLGPASPEEERGAERTGA